jgi:hypothetical protein
VLFDSITDEQNDETRREEKRRDKQRRGMKRRVECSVDDCVGDDGLTVSASSWAMMLIIPSAPELSLGPTD